MGGWGLFNFERLFFVSLIHLRFLVLSCAPKEKVHKGLKYHGNGVCLPVLEIHTHHIETRLALLEKPFVGKTPNGEGGGVALVGVFKTMVVLLCLAATDATVCTSSTVSC